MRENRLHGSEGGGTELNRFSLPLSNWDSLDAGDAAMATPDWHWLELDRRRTHADADPQAGILLDVVQARLADRP